MSREVVKNGEEKSKTCPNTPWDCHRTATPLTPRSPPLAVSRQSVLAVPDRSCLGWVDQRFTDDLPGFPRTAWSSTPRDPWYSKKQTPSYCPSYTRTHKGWLMDTP